MPERFEPHGMNITVYIEQVQIYFEYYSIKAEKQAHLFLANIGHEVYTNLKVIFASQSLYEQSFSSIELKLRSIFLPK